MNNQEAKFILSAYRPGGEDAADAKFAEVLEQVSRDPELAEWFAEQRAFDVAISQALSASTIPPDLRANILAGARISQQRPRWRRPAALALAAVVVLLAAVAGMWMNRGSQIESWQKQTLAVVETIAAGGSQFDHESSDGRVLQQWLQARHAPAPAALPAGLQALPALGCKTVSFEGRSVSIICFRLHSGELIHLVVTNASARTHAPPQQPRVVQHGSWITATWTENGQACMLATKASERELRQVLPATAQAENGRPRAATKI
ncbi:MAG: hypothetical protein ABR526_13905 [Chthoniobacterales bacterium]